jgi:U32 family peptidase
VPSGISRSLSEKIWTGAQASLDRKGTQGLYAVMMSKKQKTGKLELLAPVGSLQSFFAALECGADAVFCGLKTFSARAKAKNFTIEELAQLVGYTHKLNKKIYVALNTLIKEMELPELIAVLSELEHLRVDGLIIQDLGLYHLAHTYFPEIPLHASTQMVIHNLAGVRLLEKLGFERVVLARELSLSEITYIAQNSSLELEHFVHGALCYSISGHCLFSSYIDGRSGNRGRCIQPCRRRYHHKKESGFYFSTSDFSAIELIPELARAGVMSLKIEGRMKSAEYVAAVVSAYRTVLDARVGNEKDAIVLAKEKLETAMGRKSSPGFLPGLGGADIVLPQRKGGIGKIIGRVERLKGKTVIFKTDDRIHVGDRLRIQPGNDRAGQGFTVRTLLLGKRACKVAGKGSFVSIPLPSKSKKGKVRVGDLVFMLASGKTFTMSEEACLRRLKSAPLPANKVELLIQCKEADSTITVQTTVGGTEVLKKYHVEMIAAERSPLNEETLFKVFSHTGYPALLLTKLYANDLPPVVVKPSRLKEIRRDFYANLQGIVEESQKKQSGLRLHRIKEEVCPQNIAGGRAEQAHLYIVTDKQHDLKAVKDNPTLTFIFPLTRELLEVAVRQQNFGKGERKRLIWDLPSVVFDKDCAGLKKMIEKAVDAGFASFRLNNPAHFEFLNTVTGGLLIAGPWLFSLNSQAMKVMQDLGVQYWSLSIEDDKENFKSLLAGTKRDNQLITVFCPVELFTSRIASPIQEDEFSLHNDKGEQFDVIKNQGLTVTRAHRPFSLLGKIQQLKEMGCCNFVVDLRRTGFLTVAGQNIIAAYNADCAVPETVVLNFERGLR